MPCKYMHGRSVKDQFSAIADPVSNINIIWIATLRAEV